MEEIMLNKSFIGSWGVENEENIPHEVINLFKSDNGNIYIYVPPYGGYATKEHNVKYLLITGDWTDKTTEVLYLAKGLTLLHDGGKKATAEERRKLEEYIKDKGIRYGGKFLHEIPMAEEAEEIVFYLTFQADSLWKPKRKLYLSWNPGAGAHTKDRDVFTLKEPYNYQRQIGYINEESCDYQEVCNIIEDDIYWDPAETTTIKITDSDKNLREHMNFLKLVHKEYDETAFTNLFFEFFNNAPPSLFKAFAKDVLKIENAENDIYRIKEEVTTADKRGRIDLLAEGKENVIVIENKINSGLNGIDEKKGLSQLTTYIQHAEENVLKGRKGHYFLFHPKYNDIDIAKFDKERGNEFQKISYVDIHGFMEKHKDELKEAFGGKYAEDFIDALYTHTLTMKERVEKRFINAILKSDIDFASHTT